MGFSAFKILLRASDRRKKQEAQKRFMCSLEKLLNNAEKGIDQTDSRSIEQRIDFVGEDSAPRRSICFNFMLCMGLFELLVLSLVLIQTDRGNFGAEILGKFCSYKDGSCENYITNGLIIRALLALYMTFGAFLVSFWEIGGDWSDIDEYQVIHLHNFCVSFVNRATGYCAYHG